VEWMAWTLPTGLFFAVIGLGIATCAVWGALSPAVARRGFLPMPTARGDRVFVGLLSSAYVNLAWAGFTDASQWIAVAISAVLMLVIGRWG
jgi:predicted small integral membrane protein